VLEAKRLIRQVLKECYLLLAIKSYILNWVRQTANIILSGQGVRQRGLFAIIIELCNLLDGFIQQGVVNFLIVGGQRVYIIQLYFKLLVVDRQRVLYFKVSSKIAYVIGPGDIQLVLIPKELAYIFRSN
jgi:hypothetical protein